MRAHGACSVMEGIEGLLGPCSSAGPVCESLCTMSSARAQPIEGHDALVSCLCSGGERGECERERGRVHVAPRSCLDPSRGGRQGSRKRVESSQAMSSLIAGLSEPLTRPSLHGQMATDRPERYHRQG